MLARLGRYTVDEVELSGPPDTLVIRGKASDMRGSGKTTRIGSWEGVSLGSIVNDVAARNGWLPICPVATEVPRADQLSESDFNNNEDAPEGLPPIHTDRHIYPNKSAAEQAAKARLTAFNRSTAAVRLEMPGRTDLFAERSINAQGFTAGLDGQYLVDSVEQVFNQSGWSTTVECIGGKQGKAKTSGLKPVVPLKIVDL